MNNPWNERYNQLDYVYGQLPNKFFAEQLQLIPSGLLLLPCEGEGRNAVYAASQSWQVFAFDGSEVGRAKAMQLAKKQQVNFDYTIADATLITYTPNSFDAIAFIYAHFPPAIRQTIHRKAIDWLKPGGKIILEAFNPLQLNNSSGGPKDLEMLYTESMLQDDFEGMTIDLLTTTPTTLAEGKYHEGKADVIRMIATKQIAQ